MLTVDLLRLRASGTDIKPVRAKRERALPLAEALLEVFRDANGKSLEALDAEIGAVDAAPTDLKVRQGLAKLLKDELTLQQVSSEEAAQVRAQVFLEAAARRKAGSFDRDDVLRAVAEARNESPAALDEALFCDLRGETRITAAYVTTAEDLVDRYERAQEDALLMRATVVKATLPSVSPATFRALFRKLKFLGLLFRVAARSEDEGGGYVLTIDGPSSLFGPTTRYGLSFVHLLPTLRLAGSFSLTADIRYRNRTYVFRKEETRIETHEGASAREAEWLGEVPAALLRALRKGTRDDEGEGEGGGAASVDAGVCHDLIEGRGEVLVPDLVLRDGQKRVYLEVLGKHDRDAFFRRLAFMIETPPDERRALILCAPKALRVHPDLVKPADGALTLLIFHGQPSSTSVLRAAREFFKNTAKNGDAMRLR